MALALLRELLKAENAARTNTVVEERAAFAWVLRAFKRNKPKTPLISASALTMTSAEIDKMGPMSSSSSSVETDDDESVSETTSHTLPSITRSQEPPMIIPKQMTDDDFQRVKLAQSEWQQFEDRARELRRLVDAERDPEALRQLQHLKKPKLGRLKKSELPSLMVASRYMRAEETTQSSTPPEERVTAQDVAIMREQAARRRRQQVTQQQSPTPLREGVQEGHSSPQPPPSRATKLPSLHAPLAARAPPAAQVVYQPLVPLQPEEPSNDDGLASADALLTPAIDNNAVRSILQPEEQDQEPGHTRPMATPTMSPLAQIATSPHCNTSSHSSPERHAAAQDLSEDIIAEAAQRRAHEMLEVSGSQRRFRSALLHVEEMERVTRSDVIDDEGESRREVMRNALMESTAIIRKERELASAEREAAFRQELQQGEQRRHFSQSEQRGRQAIVVEYEKALLRVDSSLMELRFDEGYGELSRFESSEWESLMSVHESERKLCSRIAEERRVREEAERRIRVYAERRAREERERLFAEKHRSDVRSQMSMIALEIDGRHSIDHGENEGYVMLLQHAATVHRTVSAMREELMKREAEERLHRERENLRQRLAAEHGARRDLQMDEDKSRNIVSSEAKDERTEILRSMENEQQAVACAVARRLLRTLIASESSSREEIVLDEDTTRIRTSSTERSQVLFVLEKVKLREAEESRKAFEDADRALKEALQAKLEAAERLREETEQMERERNARRLQDAEIRLLSQISLLSNEEQLHRQLFSSAASTEYEALQGREETARGIVRAREVAAEERRYELERSVERRRRDNEYEELLRRDIEETSRRREREESVRREEERMNRAEENESPGKRSTSEEQSAHQRYVAIQLAQQLADEEARRRKEKDAREWEARRLQHWQEVVSRLESSEETERLGVSGSEKATREKLSSFAEAHHRSAKDRETLRLIEGSLTADTYGHLQNSTGEALSPERRRRVSEEEDISRDKVYREEVQSRKHVREVFLSETTTLVKTVLDTEKEMLAAAHPEIAALLLREREKASEERNNAILAALYSLNRFEQESRAMMLNAEDQAIEKLRTHKEHDCVLAKGRESKRIAEETEQARRQDETRRVQQHRHEERILLEAQQQLSLAKDEVMHRQVVELAEQADFDNISSRALHGRVVLETKEAARLREQQRKLEHLATIAARTEVMLSLVNSDESGNRVTIQSNEFSERRLVLEWFTTRELQVRAEDARAFAADAIRQSLRATPATPSELDQESSLDRALREKEEAFRRARVLALDRSRPTSSMDASHPDHTSKSASLSRAVTPHTSPPMRRPPSNGNPFSELDIRRACVLMDAKTLTLFAREESFLRTSIELSEHAIRKDIHREERHVRRSRGENVSPSRDRVFLEKEIRQEMESSIATEGYLRGALEAEEHHHFLFSVGEARAAGIILLEREVSPLRNHIIHHPNVDISPRVTNTTAVQKWLRASMEVVFQEEYHRREQIIAEYNRTQLEVLMKPFEQELEYVQVMGDEVGCRHAIESEEAVVATKFLKRLKRQVKVWELLMHNSQDARKSVLREFHELIKVLSRDELASIVTVPRPQPAPAPAPPLQASPVPSMNITMFPLEPVDLPPSAMAWQPQRSSSPPPAWNQEVLKKPSSNSHIKFRPSMSEQDLRDALVDVEIDQARARSALSSSSLHLLSEVIRTAAHCTSIADMFRSCRLELQQLYMRREATIRELIRSDMREQWGVEHHKIAISEAGSRRALVSLEDASRLLARQYHTHLTELCSTLSRAQRTRRVLYESVELEYVSVTRLAEQRALQNKIGLLVSREEQARLSLNADEVFEFKRVRREIVDMLDTKAKIDVEFINQKKRLVQDEEQVERLQREWTYDLLVRLSQRFLRLQQSVEIAVAQFSAAKQSWSLEQCLEVQQELIDHEKRRQEITQMVLSTLGNQEQIQRDVLVEQEDWFVRQFSRWNRFVEAAASFTEKCLAAKIAIVERLAGPGLPPPPNVLQSRLPRLKSVLQRSASMAVVMNRVGDEEAPSSPPARSPSVVFNPSFGGSVEDTSDGRLSTSISTVRSFRVGDLDRKASLFDLQPTKSMGGISPGGSMSFRRSPAMAKFVEEDVQDAINEVHELPSKDLEQMAVMLRDNDQVLREVDFSPFGDILTPSIVRTFAALSSQNTNANRASFTGIPVDEEWVEGIARIANRLGSVDLTSCSLTDGVLAALCDRWSTAAYGSNLREIIIDSNAKLTAAAASHLARVARASHSVLSTVSTRQNTAITAVHVKWLAFYLDLNKQHRQFKSVLLAVEARQEIPRLNFCIPKAHGSFTKVADQFRREFDDRSVRLLCIAVSNNTTVESISFRGNRITDKGAKLLVIVLKKNRSIRELDLAHNEISDEGAAAFEETLSSVNTTLMHLDLSENKNIQDAQRMYRISQLLKKNIDKGA